MASEDQRIPSYQYLLLPKEKSKAAVKLANAQTNDTVAGRIFEVPWDILTSDDGVDAVVAKLKTYYGQKDDLYAWDIFAEWWWSKRKRGESMLDERSFPSTNKSRDTIRSCKLASGCCHSF